MREPDHTVFAHELTHPANLSTLPPEQQRIWAKCYHPTGTFVEFKKEAIEQSVSERFEQQVSKHPDRLAVKTKMDRLSYTELNTAANRVAQAILNQQGEGNKPIALLLEHGVAMIASILGTFKAGKIYLPLDPTYPRSRLYDMLEDSQAGLIVTNTENLSLARAFAKDSLELLNIDVLPLHTSSDNPELMVPPDSLARILYTSGSTGEPKGVVQNHRNILHMIMRHTNNYHICPQDRLSQLRSFNVNGSTLHTFGALLNGAAVFPFDLKQEGIASLAKWLRQEEITLCGGLGPTPFRHFVATLTGKERFPQLRVLSLSGEPLYKSDVDLWQQHFSPNCILLNSLGATEASNIRQYYMDQESVLSSTIVPVGYATDDISVFLINEENEIVEGGEVGEIVTKSRYLAPGYWRKQALTQSVFLPDSAGSDARLYRTGDLGRMLPDGCLVHLGRKDFQVKVRGFRIELAEIEGTLMALDMIKEAVVVARKDRRGDSSLVAYIVSTVKPAPTVTTLRRLLAERLPVHMVPSAFVILDALPYTPNHKVDRRALPIPSRTRPVLNTPFVAPRTPVEENLAAIWADILGLDQVGIYDHFLDLGGHSLLASQILIRVLERFRINLSVRELWESPTVAEMAVVIVQHRATQADPETLTRLLAEVEALVEDDEPA